MYFSFVSISWIVVPRHRLPDLVGNFEKENIHTMSSDGELMLTVLASYAQEESRSASENQKWSIKKNFEEGKPWTQRQHLTMPENGYVGVSSPSLCLKCSALRLISSCFRGREAVEQHAARLPKRKRQVRNRAGGSGDRADDI